jgi:hypothetical protein
MLPVDESVNVTFNGAVPDVGVPENAATGATGAALTVMYPGWIFVLDPPGPLTVNWISYNPEPVNVNAFVPSGVNGVQVDAEVSL